jgi:hypothetical protein
MSNIDWSAYKNYDITKVSQSHKLKLEREAIEQQIKNELSPMFNIYDGELTELGDLVLHAVIGLEADIIRERNYQSTVKLYL